MTETRKFFTDLDGTNPAKEGDLVACAHVDGMILTQPDEDKRPRVNNGEVWIDGFLVGYAEALTAPDPSAAQRPT